MTRLLGKRSATMECALALLGDRRNIVETGSAHLENDWEGAGLSTVIFGEWASRHDGHLWTVDISPDAIAECKRLTPEYAEWITYCEADSVAFLSAFDQPIDLLYLDSYDYPYGSLLDLYGGHTDLNAAIASLTALSEREVVERHGEIIEASQQHCQREIQAALPNLHQHSVVLIDDAALPGGGKPRLAREVLTAAGWECLLDSYQTLWVQS